MMVIPGHPVLGRKAGPQITFVASATSARANITIPATAQPGDLAVLFDIATSGSAMSPVVPSGWAQIGTSLGGLGDAVMTVASRRVLEAGNPGSSVAGMDGNIEDAKIMLVFRPTMGTWGAPASGGEIVATGNPGSATSQTIATGATPYVAIAAWGGNAAPDAGFSPAHDGQVTRGATRIARYRVFNNSPESVAVTADAPGGGWRMVRSFRIPLLA